MLKAIMTPRRRSVMQAVRNHLHGMPAGTIFTPAELLLHHIGSPDAIRQALTRLVRLGHVRRVRKGYYERPRLRDRSQETAPSKEALARAFAHKVAARQLRATYARVEEEPESA